jgi:hypothetical protein
LSRYSSHANYSYIAHRHDQHAYQRTRPGAVFLTTDSHSQSPLPIPTNHIAMFSYHSTRTRDRSPIFAHDDDDAFYASRRLVRTNSKRARADLYDDDAHDDYPYANTKARPSRALTIRQPASQLEKYNVWTRPSASPRKHASKYGRLDEDDDDDDEARTVRYKYTTARYPSYSPSYARDDDADDDREREFRLKIKASFGRPSSRHAHSSERPAAAWPSDVFRSREKWVDEDWESREREGRRDSVFDEERVGEKSVRFRRVKRTRTEEWRPLSGWRR